MRAELEMAARAFRLAWPRAPLSGRAGERLGRAAGSSLEFMDYRDYQPGDDLRHVDWRGYARTDQLRIRLYREEVSPGVDLIVDTSPSLAVSERKERAARDLVDAFSIWVATAGGTLRRIACDGDVVAGELRFDGPLEGRLVPRLPLRPRSVRIVLSDFLFENDPATELRRLAANAAELIVLQLLDPWESDPEPLGAVALVDCESNARAQLVLDERAVAAYRERLNRLTSTLERATRSAGGRFARILADAPRAMFEQQMLRLGLLVPT